jgi:hypothetical protein
MYLAFTCNEYRSFDTPKFDSADSNIETAVSSSFCDLSASMPLFELELKLLGDEVALAFPFEIDLYVEVGTCMEASRSRDSQPKIKPQISNPLKTETVFIAGVPFEIE